MPSLGKTSMIIAVAASARHSFSKPPALQITLIPAEGVLGDAHSGRTVKHRSRVARDPSQPNLRQIHLLQAELFEELARKGFRISPGDLGENITTRGINLLGLPTDTILKLGSTARVQIKGLRNPCSQLEKFQPGLMQATLDRAPDGALIRKAGIMGVVLTGGDVLAGDAIEIALPSGSARPLEPV